MVSNTEEVGAFHQEAAWCENWTCICSWTGFKRLCREEVSHKRIQVTNHDVNSKLVDKSFGRTIMGGVGRILISILQMGVFESVNSVRS